MSRSAAVKELMNTGMNFVRLRTGPWICPTNCTMATGIAKFAGAKNIVVTDLSEYRLEIAKKMGATLTVNATKGKTQESLTGNGINLGCCRRTIITTLADALNDRNLGEQRTAPWRASA